MQVLATLVAALTFLSSAANTILLANADHRAAQDGSRFFPETGQTVQGRFLDYWQLNGGLTQYGYPLTAEQAEVSPVDGKIYTLQYFERAVFELHPENSPPNDVLLSLLGTLRWQALYGADPPKQQVNNVAPRFFPETGRTIGGRFREHWEQNGGLARNGYPLSDEFQERSEIDGKLYTVQYFERAVFEQHPENSPPYDVLLSQLGAFRLVIAQAKQAAATLDSPPRTYVTPASQIELWPDSSGSNITSYSTCGTVPGGDLGPIPCQQPMTLSTALAKSGADWKVSFLASWADGTLRHIWVLRVGADGRAGLLEETGDKLPILPQ